MTELTAEQVETMRAQVAAYDEQRLADAQAKADELLAPAQTIVDESLPLDLADQLDEARSAIYMAAPQLASLFESLARSVRLISSSVDRAKAKIVQDEMAKSAPAEPEEPAA